MKNALTKALAISSIAGLGLLTTTNAQATSITPAQNFFNPAGANTIADGTWSATGEGSTPNPLVGINDWTATLTPYPDNMAALFTVSRAATPFAPSPNSFITTYSITNAKAPIDSATVALDLVGFNNVKNGSIVKEIYADAEFTVLLGTASTIVAGGTETTIDAFFAPQETIYVKDIIRTSGGDLSSYTNSFASVPEPLTMLGAAAAVTFGTAFKRNAAKKQNNDKA
ncbi:MAG: PEP-CTERM sorting domain-containing protein [Synechocystis sp.]|nr:PEP-CTERM sorting domain-containing protein [Synechocystis sp.]